MTGSVTNTFVFNEGRDLSSDTIRNSVHGEFTLQLTLGKREKFIEVGNAEDVAHVHDVKVGNTGTWQIRTVFTSNKKLDSELLTYAFGELRRGGVTDRDRRKLAQVKCTFNIFYAGKWPAFDVHAGASLQKAVSLKSKMGEL